MLVLYAYVATKQLHTVVATRIPNIVVEKAEVIVCVCLMVELIVRQALSAVAGYGIVEILG